METDRGHSLAEQGRNLGGLLAVGIEGLGLGCKHLAWGAVRSADQTAHATDTG